MNNLAVVIPAYKGEFLREALLSLAQQTNKKFNVYIGDDCSPDQLKSITDEFLNLISIDYHRFETNLGKTDLVKHWERCVALIKEESWIWIFSDDDIAEPGCVEAFYAALNNTNQFFDVYRFNTCVIDQHGQFLSAANESPQIEDAISLAYHILLGERGNSMPDHIFKRSVYTKNDGVVNFIQAQASDWATSIKFALDKGLYTIAGPKIKWRLSGKNISSIAYKSKSRLLFGHLQFIDWVNKIFTPADEAKSVFKRQDIRIASKQNLTSVINYHYRGVPYLSMISVASKVSNIFNISLAHSFIFCLKINFKLMKKDIKQKIRRIK